MFITLETFSKALGWGINAQPLEKLIIWQRAVTSDPAHFAQLDKSALICDL